MCPIMLCFPNVPWKPVIYQLLHVRVFWKDGNWNQQFVEEIRKYDCLFNRSSKEFKDKFKKINAWSKEAEC